MTTSFGSMRTRRATRLWQVGFYAVMITMSVVDGGAIPVHGIHVLHEVIHHDDVPAHP